MANRRKAGKRLVEFFATDEEHRLLHEAAKVAGFATLADYLRWIARHQPVPPTSSRPADHPDKTIG